MTGWANLQNALETLLWQFLVTFFRVAPVIAFLPGTGERSLPNRIKLVVALAATLVVFPLAPALAPSPPDVSTILKLVLPETAAGLAIGLATRIMLFALQTAGAMIAQATSLAQLLGNNGADPMPAVGHLLVIGGVSFAMLTNLHTISLIALLETYRFWPLGTWPAPSQIGLWGLDIAVASFALAFTLSLPFLAVSLLYYVTLGVINRAMPQLMVAFIGAPLITFGGLAMLAFLVPTMLSIWRDALAALLNGSGPP